MPLPDRTKSKTAELAYEVAFRYFTPEELQIKFGLDAETYEALQVHPDFRRAVQEFARDIDESGAYLKAYARKQVALLAENLVTLVQSSTVPPADRIAAFKELRTIGGLGAPDAANGQVPFSVQINLGTHVQAVQAVK